MPDRNSTGESSPSPSLASFKDRLEQPKAKAKANGCGQPQLVACESANLPFTQLFRSLALFCKWSHYNNRVVGLNSVYVLFK